MIDTLRNIFRATKPTEQSRPTFQEYLDANESLLMAETRRTGENWCDIGKRRYAVEYPDPTFTEKATLRVKEARDATNAATAAQQEAEAELVRLATEWEALNKKREKLRAQIATLDDRIGQLTGFDAEQAYGECALNVIENELGGLSDHPWIQVPAKVAQAKHLPVLRKRLAKELVEIESNIDRIQREQSLATDN